MQFAFRWVGLVGSQRRVAAIERRAIGAHILNILAHVAEDMRMVLWRQRTYAHECLGADLDDRHAGLVVEMRNDLRLSRRSLGKKTGFGLQPFADDPGTLLTVARPSLREDVVDHVIALNAERGLNELGGGVAVVR